MEEREQGLLRTLLQDLGTVFQRTGLPGPCQVPLPEPFQTALHSGEPPPSRPVEHVERLTPAIAHIRLTAAPPPAFAHEAYRYPLKPLSVAYDHLAPKQENDLTGYLREDYRQIWRGLTEAMEHLRKNAQFDAYFFTLFFLLKRHLSRVPSSQAADLSMFDQARIAAALDDCRYLYHKEQDRKKTASGVLGGKGTEELKPVPGSEAENRPDSPGEEKEFLLIGGELAGIQRFLCAMSASQQEHARQVEQLRGRSFYLLLLAETLVEYLLRALDLKLVHQLWRAGGQFLLIAPNTPAITYHLKACYYDIKDFLLKKFQGDLSFALNSLPVSYSMLHTRCGEAYLNVQRLLQREHTRPFCSVLQEQGPAQFPASATEEVFSPERLGRRLAGLNNGDGRLVMKVKAADDAWRGDPLVTFEIGKTRHIAWEVNPAEDTQIETIYCVNNLEAPFWERGNARSGFKLLATYADEQPDAKADGLLGVLRMDVDQLGLMLGAGFAPKNHSLTRLAAFSADLDLFLTGYLQHLCQTKFPQQASLLYAGGDDVCLAGNWRQIVTLACRIQEDFTAFTCGNPDVHLSGAIVVYHGRYPFSRAFEQAGIGLDDLAKANLTGEVDLKGIAAPHNALAIFNHRLPWNDLRALRDVGNRLIEAVRNQKLSRQTLYTLLDLHRTWTTYKTLNTARMYYLTARKIQDTTCRNVFLAQHHYLANPSYIPILVRYVALHTRPDRQGGDHEQSGSETAASAEQPTPAAYAAAQKF